MLFRKSGFSCFLCLVIFAKDALKMITCGSRAVRGDWQRLFGVGLLVITVLAVRCEGGKMSLEDPFRLGCRLKDMAESLRLHVDSVVGAHTTEQCLTVSKTFLRRLTCRSLV